MAPSPKRSRPVRALAGKKKLPTGFVDTAQHVDSHADEASSSDDGSIDEDVGRGRKRRRSRSPDQLPLVFEAPGASLEDPKDIPSDDELSPSLVNDTYTLKIPGRIGESFSIKLVLESSDNSPTTLSLNSKDKPKVRIHNVPGTSDTRVGFLSLPAELRNNIYRLIFVREGQVDNTAPTGFSRSAAFLRTCRLVYLEGTAMLYGSNKFAIRRDIRARGEYWEANWQEIGWKDVRRFFSALRPETIQLINDLQISFDDAPRTGTPNLATEERYFWNDENLINVLKFLAIHSKLARIKLNFRGHKRLERGDYSASRFLHHLRRIRVDELEIEGIPLHRNRYFYTYREQGGVSQGVADFLRERMLRKTV